VNKRTIVAGAFLVFTAVIFSGCSLVPEESLEIGRPAPAFKLPDLNGRSISLDQFKGKIVLLDFWATWCGPCRMSMPLLERLQKEYPTNLALLAINLQEPQDTVREYMRQQNLSSQVLLDQDGSIGQIYGAGSIPMQVLIDKDGIVREVQAGFNPKLISVFRSKIENLR
jgi:thiol-disulfide isomerase/thioredoxin